MVRGYAGHVAAGRRTGQKEVASTTVRGDSETSEPPRVPFFYIFFIFGPSGASSIVQPSASISFLILSALPKSFSFL